MKFFKCIKQVLEVCCAGILVIAFYSMAGYYCDPKMFLYILLTNILLKKQYYKLLYGCIEILVARAGTRK